MKQKFKWLLALVAMVASVNLWGADPVTIYTNAGATGTASGITAAGNINTNNGNPKPSFGYTKADTKTITLTNCNFSTYTNVNLVFDYQMSKTSGKYSSFTVTQYDKDSKTIGSASTVSGTNNTSYKTCDGIALSSSCVKITIVCNPANGTQYGAYVDNIKITGIAASEKTNVSLNANSNGKADGSVKYTVGNTTPDETPSWVTPKDNTGWILNGYYTAASGGTKIITASNTLVANTTYADASNKWKYKETSLTLYAQWGKTTCETPSNLGQTSVTATSATLTWGTVTGAASYTVFITDADSYEKTIDNITTNSTTLNDLSPNTEYIWSVKAIGNASNGYSDGELNDDGYFTTETACISPVTINKSDATLPEGCSFELSKTSGCGDDAGESVLVTCSPATHYTVTAVSSTSGTPGTISNNKCTVSGIKESTTISVTFTEDTKYTITFADNLQHTASIPNTTNNEIVVYENEIFTFPTISDKTAATSGTCEQIHYHFMGWVLSTHEGTIAAGDIKTGTSDAVSSEATYYAVWAKEEL